VIIWLLFIKARKIFPNRQLNISRISSSISRITGISEEQVGVVS
jgi:hypothetical protein